MSNYFKNTNELAKVLHDVENDSLRIQKIVEHLAGDSQANWNSIRKALITVTKMKSICVDE